jgi:hypothetical protein
MNTLQTREKTFDEEWIVKYRAALNAAPIHEPRAVRFRAALDSAYSNIVSSIGRIVDVWSHEPVEKATAALEPEEAPKPFPTSFHKKGQPSANNGGARRAS